MILINKPQARHTPRSARRPQKATRPSAMTRQIGTGLYRKNAGFGGFLKWGRPINRWFTMENPVKLDGLEVPLFQETTILREEAMITVILLVWDSNCLSVASRKYIMGRSRLRHSKPWKLCRHSRYKTIQMVRVSTSNQFDTFEVAEIGMTWNDNSKSCRCVGYARIASKQPNTWEQISWGKSAHLLLAVTSTFCQRTQQTRCRCPMPWCGTYWDMPIANMFSHLSIPFIEAPTRLASLAGLWLKMSSSGKSRQWSSSRMVSWLIYKQCAIVQTDNPGGNQ